MSIEVLSKNEGLFKFQLDLLSKEIDYIHSRIAHYDELSFKIKGWAITLWSGIVAFGAKEGLALVVLASIPATITFWIVDTFFKKYQRYSMFRMGVIESFIDSNDSFAGKGLCAAFTSGEVGNFPIHDPVGIQSIKLYEKYKDRYEKRTSFWNCSTANSLLYFYLIPLLSAVALAFFFISKR